MSVEWIEIGNCRIACGDCLEILPTLPDGAIEAIVTDPPYGIGESSKNHKSRNKLADSPDYVRSNWDNNPCDKLRIDLMRYKSKWQIIFGGNYFDLPPSSCWLVWDKLNGDNDFADCELAWTNLPRAVRRIQFRWAGMLRDGHDVRVHPTQKPVAVMQWAIGYLPSSDGAICDPFMGSGTTLEVCMRNDRQSFGIERDPAYFEIARKRLERAWQDKQSELPFEPEPQMVQRSLLTDTCGDHNPASGREGG